MNANAEMIRVIHSVQRQLRLGFETIQPPTIGAIVGALIEVSWFWIQDRRCVGHTCNIRPCYDREHERPLDWSELIFHTRAIDRQRRARKQSNKVPAKYLAAESWSQSRAQNKEHVAKGRDEIGWVFSNGL